jgi:hypothetical protein
LSDTCKKYSQICLALYRLIIDAHKVAKFLLSSIPSFENKEALFNLIPKK